MSPIPAAGPARATHEDKGLRILFVAPYVPTPIRVRPFQLLRALAARGHSLTLVCPTGGAEDEDASVALAPVCRLVRVPVGPADTLAAYLRALPAGLPLQAAHRLSPALVAAVRGELAHSEYDLVHVEHLRAAEVARAATSGLSGAPPVVLDSVDSISLLFERAVRHSPTAATRAMALVDLARTRRYEAGYGRTFAGVVCTSPEDRWALQTLRAHFGEPPGAPVTVVPNGVDLDYFRPPGTPRDPATIVFSGKMSYHANEAAALFLLDAIMPLVWRDHPAARVIIAGAAPGPRLLAHARDLRVEVTGYVADLRPYLARATVAVAPIRYGVGVQNKVLEAMAMGTPVVAARQATLALAARPEADLLVAQDAPGFAAQLGALLAQPARREALGRAGHAYVAAHHSWHASAALLEGAYAACFGESATKRFVTTKGRPI